MDYTISKEWSYKGDLPCIIDFYADWCGPCNVAPILEELADEYAGKIIYRVDTEAEQELSAVLELEAYLSPLRTERQTSYDGMRSSKAYFKTGN
ncbi:MAG: thioredoxin domain-containing protein [Chitinophagales bacterium]